MPLMALTLMAPSENDGELMHIEWVVQHYWFDCGFLHWLTHDGDTVGKALDQFTDYSATYDKDEIARILAAEEKEE